MITINQFRRIVEIAKTAPLFLEQREWLETIEQGMEAEWAALEKQQQEADRKASEEAQSRQELVKTNGKLPEV